MTSTPKLPAFRITRGAVIKCDDRRVATVTGITPVVFYSRNRKVELAPADRNGVTLTVRLRNGGAFRTITLRNNELVTVAR